VTKPYMKNCYYVEMNNEKQVTVSEEVNEMTLEEIIENWSVPPKVENPTVVDPENIFNYKDLPTDCQNYKDLIEWNKQEDMAVKYITMLKESVAEKFGLKFKRNFELIQELLLLIVFLEYKEDKGVDITHIQEQMTRTNEEIRTLLREEGVNGGFKGNLKSTILDKTNEKNLYKMLGKKARATYTLIHTSDSGMGAGTFDSAVTGKGPFLVIIKATNNYVFGAYVQDTFGSSLGTGWKPGSQETFLFTFGTDGTRPIKLLHKGSGDGIHISSCGLHLSTDLVTFCSNSCSPSVYTVVAPGYPSVTVDSNLLAGASYFTQSYIEVWSVIPK